LSEVKDLTTGLIIANDMTFNAAGETLTRTLNPGSNAIVETFAYYDDRLELQQIRATKGSTDLMKFTYDYGSASTNTGRLLSRTDWIQPEHSVSYSYDSIYRLTQVIAADNSWGVAWAFDVWGNRTAQTAQGLVAMSKIGPQTLGYVNNRNTTFNYDAAGNQT